MASVLVVNAGSTSLKLHLVDEAEGSRPVGSIEAADSGQVAGVAHRVVHGGPKFRGPVVIDTAVLEQISKLELLAPLHNAPALAGINHARNTLPDVPHIAVFDTGFHRTIPEEAAVYAIPARWRDQWDVRRYGFHGLSVAWSVERTARLLDRPERGLRLVVCHLGGGCSVTAVRDGRSVDTTMGFSPLGGVPMATRSGSIDPEVLLYLMRERGVGVEELERALNLDSGLRGLAGGSGSMIEIERAAAGGDPDAEFAITVFTHRIAGAVAAMAAAAGGLDALVFTAGIGENSSAVRKGVCSRLGFLGVELDSDRNRAAEPDCELARPESKVGVAVIRAREELVAARAARQLL